jgi:ABC-type lipoprotein release transport system permease subunit
MGTDTDLPEQARPVRRRRGQAMVEYSAVLFALATAGGVGIIVVLPMFMNGLNRYLQGIYYMLNLAIP